MADNKHNDPLESFFKKKAGEYNIQYKEEDWEKLEQRLDTVDKQYAARKKQRLAAAAVIILFSILGYFTYEQQQKINQLNERLSNTERTTQLPGMLPNEILKENKTPTEPADPDSEAQSTEPNFASNEPTAQDSEPSVEKKSETKLVSGETSKEVPLSDILSETNLVMISAKDSPGGDGRSPAISAINPPKFSTNIALTESPRVNSSTESSTSTYSSRQTFSRFTVGVLAGPDMSTVGGVSNFYDPGHKLGLSVEYNISKNLAVSVGAIRSKVRYTAAGNKYQPPQGYWSYGTVPDETIGECILIDIPISLKYDFWNFNDSRLYATAGLSSYIMLDEDYRFNYDYNRPGQKQRWHERTGTRHWMSNATLSVGYELDIMKNFSIRAEPFLRLPLQEVGWGNVKLYSMGSLVSLNYHIH